MIELFGIKLAITDLLTACSILIALGTWHVSHRREVKAKRVEYTAEVIAALSTSERLAASSFVVTKLINDGVRLSMENVDQEIESHVVDILDYYEFICDLYAKKVVDRETIVQLRGRLMRRTWQVCEQYIKDTGKRQNRKIYDGFERFVQCLPADDSPVFTARAPRTLWRSVQRLVNRSTDSRASPFVGAPEKNSQGLPPLLIDKGRSEAASPSVQNPSRETN